MKGLTQRTQTIGTCFVSYVGKANFGAAEYRAQNETYIRERGRKRRESQCLSGFREIER